MVLIICLKDIMSKLEIKIYNKLDKKVLRKWKNLWNKSKYSHIFNSPAWFTAYCTAYDISDYKIVVLSVNGEVKAILPLVKLRKYGIKVYTNPASFFSDKACILLDKKDAQHTRLILKKASTCGNVCLPEIEESLVKNLKLSSGIMFRPSSVNLTIPLNPDPLANLSNKQKNKIKNKYKRLASVLTFKEHKKADESILQKVFSINERSYKKLVKGYKDPFANDKDKLFFKLLNEKAPNNVVINFMCYKDTPIFYEIGFITQKVYYASQTAYLSEARSFMPGKLYLYWWLKKLQKNGLEIFDFGRGENVLKNEFANKSSEHIDLYFSNSYLTRLWWKVADNLVSSAKNNQRIYSLICGVRKNLNTANFEYRESKKLDDAMQITN